MWWSDLGLPITYHVDVDDEKMIFFTLCWLPDLGKHSSRLPVDHHWRACKVRIVDISTLIYPRIHQLQICFLAMVKYNKFNKTIIYFVSGYWYRSTQLRCMKNVRCEWNYEYLIVQEKRTLSRPHRCKWINRIHIYSVCTTHNKFLPMVF